MLTDLSARPVIPTPPSAKQSIKRVKSSFGSVLHWFAGSRFALPGTEVKLLFALGIGAALLFALGAINASTIWYSQRTFDLFSATATFVSEVQRVRGMVDDLELLKRRYLMFGEHRDLTQSETLREQLNSSLQAIEQEPYGGLVRIGQLPRLKARTRAERAALVESNASKHKFGAVPAYLVAQSYSDKRTLASLREQLKELYDSEQWTLGHQLYQQRKRQSELMTVSATLAAGAGILFLFICSLTLGTLAVNRQLRSTTPKLSLNETKHSPAASTSAAHAVAPLVEAARAAERASIARDIHDELGALLMAIKIDLKCSSKTNTTSRRAVDSQWPVMLDRVDAAMSTVARIAGRLRPIIVDQIGLWPAIESYVREFEEVTKIPCKLRIDASHLPLQGEVAHEIFRIVQESLTNVARHAEASTVDVRIGVKRGQLEVEITDDGTGISADQILDRHSHGVAGMFERTRGFGGELHIDGRPQGGTKVTLRVPVLTLQ